MPTIISSISYIFDLFITVIFLEGTLKTKKAINPLIYYIAFIIAETFLLFSEIMMEKGIIINSYILSTLLDFLVTLMLTLLYNASLTNRLFISISYHILAILGEAIFTWLIFRMGFEYKLTNYPLIYSMMYFGSKISLFIFVLIFLSFWNKKSDHDPIKHNLLFFATPILSLAIFLFLPEAGDSLKLTSSFYFVLTCSLYALNIINYIMIIAYSKYYELLNKNSLLNQQVLFQKEKYLQLSSSYKNTRSLVHDAKKHYLALDEFIKNKEYDKLSGYLYTANSDLENTYAAYNTGNLVIDSFLTNYNNIAIAEHISFEAELSVDPDKVPIDDYSLCIILGNLLDNSINACQKLPGSDRHIYFDAHIDDKDRFIINVKNPIPTMPNKNDSSSYLIHGYGLENVNKVVEKNRGMINIDKSNGLFDVCIVFLSN